MQIYLHAAAYQELTPAIRRHRFLQTLPLYSSAGRKASLACLMRGDALIIQSSLFDAGEFLDAVAQFNATAELIVPSAVRQLLRLAKERNTLLRGMECLTSVGAPLFPDEKRETLRSITPNFQDFYGTTAIGPVSVLRASAMAERPSSVGRPFSLIEVEVVDEHDQSLGSDIVGRLRCRSPGLASPVIGSANEAVADFRDGWYYPGELASIDPLGYIYLKGRTSEVIYRGGAKIFPGEVESVLQMHDAVTESAVVAIRSSENENEQMMIAYVTCRREVTAGELIAHCRTHLTAFKVPREINIVSALPKNSSGKIDKLALNLSR